MLYQFSVSYDDFYQNSNVTTFSFNKPTQISREKFAEAIDALHLIHHLDQKGNILANDTPC